MEKAENESLDSSSYREMFTKYFKLYCNQYRDDTNQQSPCNTNQLTHEEFIVVFLRLARIVESQGIFSKNEHVDDINTEDLPLLLIPFLLGELFGNGTSTENRLQNLKNAIIYWNEFLSTCKTLLLFKPEQLALWYRNTNSYTDIQRQDKIASFLRMKDFNKKISYLLEKKLKQTLVDEELDRDLHLAYIQRSIDETLDHQNLVMLEIQLLESSSSEPASFDSKSSDAPKKPFLYKITDVSQIKELYRQKVFQPFHELPSISLAQVAQSEMETEVRLLGAKEREKEKKKEEREKALQEGYDVESLDSDEKDDEDDEAKELKARHWDDWKDENTKGSGNKNRNVG